MSPPWPPTACSKELLARLTHSTAEACGGRAECPSRLAVELGTAMERALVQAGVVGKMDFEELFKPVKSSYSARWMATHSTIITALHPL